MNNNNYDLLKKNIFDQARLYARAYRLQLEVNPDDIRLLNDLHDKHEMLYDIIKNAGLEDEYETWAKKNYGENDIFKI